MDPIPASVSVPAPMQVPVPSNSSTIQTIWILLGAILIIGLVYYVFQYTWPSSDSETKKAANLYSIERLPVRLQPVVNERSTTCKTCPKGCFKGFCDPMTCNKTDKHCCTSDYQCQLCKDHDGYRYVNSYVLPTKYGQDTRILTPSEFANETIRTNRAIQMTNAIVQRANGVVQKDKDTCPPPTKNH
jgi:hypothetical protein